MRLNDRWTTALAKKPLPALLLLCIFGVLMLVTIAQVPYWAIAKGWANANASGAVGSLLQGIVGAAVALAGAISTVLLAVLGLRIVDRQEHQERIDFVERYLVEALAPVAKLCASFSLLEASGRGLIYALENVETANSTLTASHGRKSSHGSQELRHIFRNLQSIQEGLNEIAVSPRAFALWQSRSGNAAQLLVRLSQRLDPEQVAHTHGLIDLIAFLTSRLGQVSEEDLANEPRFLVSAWENACGMADALGDLPERSPNPRGYLSLLLIGELLWQKTDRDATINLGAALLLDLLDNIPTEVEIMALCAQLYSSTEHVASLPDPLPGVLKQRARLHNPSNLLKPVLLEALLFFRGRHQSLVLHH